MKTWYVYTRDNMNRLCFVDCVTAVSWQSAKRKISSLYNSASSGYTATTNYKKLESKG